ncbi:energy transducer TonB [Grimontia sp. NTOU-MAR1]|uniref:energy transducer TonB n=1 Tax=Grimontia sp. NTOU-MAR1 TaxID=3111011 RepID=UPI002DBD49E8|nr:energy transducer TonB [Grimontia sp. NTOU-MAR1]WRW00935.1 energy transducer TonB [Grimontia sp. NTOU-MAR1]
MLRMLLALPMGLLSAFGLFALMATMVAAPAGSLKDEGLPLAFDVFMTEPESEIERRDRVAPTKPDVPPPPPSMQMSAPTALATAPSIQPVMPDIAMDMQVDGMSINMPAIKAAPAPAVGELTPSFGQGNQAAMPLVRIQPSYPTKALRRGIEGYVVVSFTINEEGRPSGIKIIEASPKRIFDREAIRAIKKWKYTPLLIDGKAVSQPGQSQKLEFVLTK